MTTHRRASAGHHTLPHPNATAKLISTQPRKRHAPYKYFTIIKGTHPGVYEGRWYTYESLVKHVPNANYKGFQNQGEATVAFVIAYTLGFVKAIPARDSTDFGPPRNEPASFPPLPARMKFWPLSPPLRQTFSETPGMPFSKASGPVFTLPGKSWLLTSCRCMATLMNHARNFVSDLVMGVSTATY